ncbi:hypothetical protein ACN28I_35910 [Archangium gephyra]|uniref:hypothetical protein n=1 Tax=Archangium gephyra TaxID=48 RepID=UPI003B7CB2D1
MRGSIRKWVVVGALASASLLFPGCADTNQGADMDVQDQMGTGGAGGAGMEGQEGTGGSGTGGGTMARDAGTPADAGTGGAGMEGQDVGTPGQGVSGGDEEQSGGAPTK